MLQVTDVVFDVGRVLINFTYERLIGVLQQRGATVSTVEEFTERIDLLPYEHGRITDRQFLEKLNALLADPLPEEDLAAAWRDLFTPIDEMLDLAGRLKARFGVYLMSNTSNMHWQHLLETYRLPEFCHGHLASYQVGVMKPDPQIFNIACERFGLVPQQTVFIDDMQANIEGAIACGWHGIHHRDVEETRQRLVEILGTEI